MTSRPFLAAVLSAAALAGCGVDAPTDACTLDLRFHTVEMTRDFASAPEDDPVSVEACSDTTCRTATPADDGALSFAANFTEGAVDGTTKTVAGSRSVTVRWSLGEKGASARTPLRLVMKRRDGAPIKEETAEVRWSDTDCHPAPVSTKL